MFYSAFSLDFNQKHFLIDAGSGYLKLASKFYHKTNLIYYDISDSCLYFLKNENLKKICLTYKNHR